MLHKEIVKMRGVDWRGIIPKKLWRENRTRPRVSDVGTLVDLLRQLPRGAKLDTQLQIEIKNIRSYKERCVAIYPSVKKADLL